jgi:hypothetical protein
VDSKKAVWVGRIITIFIVLFMLVDAAGKILKLRPYVEGTIRLGYHAGLLVPLGILALVCTILYAIPRTAVLGAILLTAYFGGATATHVRLGLPFYFPVAFGILVWVALYLRDARLRALIPLTSS